MNQQEQPDRLRELLAIVHGDVQGVFFRKFVEEKAQALGLSGSVENLTDGTVEVIAQGKESVLRVLMAQLYAGSENAEVESVNVQWGPIEQPVKGFSVL